MPDDFQWQGIRSKSPSLRKSSSNEHNKMFRQLIVVTLVGLALSAPSNKIDGKLQQVLSSKGVANVVVSFNGTTDHVIQRVKSQTITNRTAMITSMMTQLEGLRATTQQNALRLLKGRSARYESLWISNKIYITGANAELVQALAALPEVAEVREQMVFKIDERILADNSTISNEWGIEKIEAPAAWSLPGGNNGRGIVVSNIDTGVRYTHEALRKTFRKEKGWYDPYTRRATPTDVDGHGTHTMGTIAGSNGIGVAPGTQWIACRGCSKTSCAEAALTACGQFITCPTNTDGRNPDCSMAPHLVSNSWGGGQGVTFYYPVINAWHAVGIIPIFSQGNSGPSCRTANSPGDIDRVIAVGSTAINDEISHDSSRGPALNGGIKPDVSAPGVRIRSAWNTGDRAYNTISGTSMACPHVSGTIALLLSRNPNLSFDQVKKLLQDNADRNLRYAATCGGTPYTTFPNNMYGYGRINARKSLAAVAGA